MISGYKDTRIPGYQIPDIRIPGYQDTRMSGIPGYQDIMISGYQDTRIL